MKLVHVVPHLSEEASGPTYAVPRLCTSLANYGHDVELTCLAASRPIPHVQLDVHPQWPILRRFALSPSHAVALRKKAAKVDVIHNHSLWSMVNVASGWVVPGQRAKLVTSPHGTLSAWALGRNRALKKILWPLQRRALEKAALIHATSEVEYCQIRALGFTSPVALIPNGIDLPVLPTEPLIKERRTLLFLSRLHPTKCVDRLLLAWEKLQHRHPDWHLLVVGKGEVAFENEMRALANRLNLNRASFPGPVYGEAKSKLYFEADLFVLPTHSENFGMVVAEALAHICPAVVSQGAPWSGLEAEGCGWWIKHDVESLTTTLDKAMSRSSKMLEKMGIKGRDWMAREFGWESIAERMAAAYRWVLDGGERPDWIRID